MAATTSAADKALPVRTACCPRLAISVAFEPKHSKALTFNCSLARATSPDDTDPDFKALTAPSIA